MAPQRYKYKPLDKNKAEIRLLYLHSSEHFSSPVRCSLFATTIDQAPTYTALSYCWGDTASAQTIDLNDVDGSEVSGTSLTCTSNLYVALQQLRQNGLKHPIWVDGICINQEDMLERGSQVMLMRDIYEQAELTFVWLGERSEGSESAIRLIKAWSAGEDDLDTFIQQCSYAFDETMWEAAKQFFQRPWWTRVWVYQEFVVSQQVLFLCGPDKVSNHTLRSARTVWNSFLSYVSTARDDVKQVGWLPLQDVAACTRPFDHQRMLNELRHIRKQLGKSDDDIEKFDLPLLLRRTWMLEATDPRDKLFALLGMDEKQDIIVVPDYEASESEVFLDFTINCIETRSSLEILIDAGVGFVEPTLLVPSWTLDPANFSMKGKSMTFKLNCAAGSYAKVPRVDRKNLKLTASGFICDLITSHKLPVEHWSQRHLEWADFALNSTREHPTGIAQAQAFFRTMTADTSGYGFGKPDFRDENDRKVFCGLAIGFMTHSGMSLLHDTNQNPSLVENLRKWLKRLDLYSIHAAYFQCFLRSIPEEPEYQTEKELLEPFLKSTNQYGELEWEYDRSSLTVEDEHRLSMKFFSHADQTTANKSFFVTESGYMGLGPRLIQNGDKVCVLFGCQHPLLLRKEGDAYLLVGDAYIYGMMRGEMIAELEAGSFIEQEFVIK